MAEQIGNNRRIAKNTIFLYLRMGVSMIISLFTARIVLSTLGDVDYGIFNVVTGCVAMFTFLNGALSGSASRFLTYELGVGNATRLRNTFSATLVVHILLAAVIVILCETIGLWFLENKLVIPPDRMHGARWAYQIGILMIVVSLIQVPYGALIIAHEKMDIYAYMSFFDIGARMALIYLLQLIPGDKLIIWSWMLLIVNALYTGIYIAYSNRMFKESHFKFHRETPLYKRLLSYAWWDLIGSISGMLQGQGINMVLNMFFGPVVNAARGISYQVQGTLNQFASNFTLASKPQIIKLFAAGHIKEMMRLVEQSGCIAFYLSWFFTLPLSLELKYVLGLWLGSYPDYTISFTLITLIMGLVVSIKSSRVSAVHATGQIKLTNITVGLILCSAFPLAYVALKLGYGPDYALIVSVLVTFLAEIIAVIILRKYIQFSIIHYFINVYLRCCAVAIISAILPIIIHNNMPESFLRLVSITVVSTICIAISVFVFGIDNQTRSAVISTIRTKLKR
ncbi:MAG: multidrug transporter [Bacteroidales bacterium]|nr:multidrug transporter [Bacteroidales bacterium]